MHDVEFKLANTVFAGNLQQQKDAGLDKSSHRTPISAEHFDQIYERYIVPHAYNDPLCLQHKVFIDLVYFMGRRGVEKLCELKKEYFVFKVDEQVLSMLSLLSMKVLKNHKVMTIMK